MRLIGVAFYDPDHDRLESTVQWEIFEGENFRRSVGKEHFAEKTFVEC